MVKFLLLPFYKKQIRSQVIMQFLAPKLKEIQEKYKEDKQKLGTEMIALYSKYKINPLSAIVVLLIQMPILLGLYFIFSVDLNYYQNLLYSFLQQPVTVNNFFLTADLLQKSLMIGVIAGVSQYILSHYMFKKSAEMQQIQKLAITKKAKDGKPNFGEEFQNAMEMQVKYFIPILIFGTSIFLPAVIPFYFIVSNVFAIWQEVYVRPVLEEKILKEIA
jgi:YidC/Oxa1 family membrane protein insertase